jgi:cysteine desulfurase
MLPYFTEEYGNPNSLYSLGRRAHKAIEDARDYVISSVGASGPSEVIFTGGGTESDTTALLGIARAAAEKSGRHVIVSAFEHHAVLEPAKQLAREGFDVEHVRPRQDGIVHPEDLKKLLRADTVLVSVMHANNEIGTVQPLKELSEATHNAGAYFHTDAVQSLGKIEVDLQDLGVDAASFSAHKIYGPKGTGALYLKKGVPFQPLIAGGGQEFRRRSGTQNVAGIVGFAAALQLMDELRAEEGPRLEALRRKVVDGVLDGIENTQLNGSDDVPRLPSIANLIIKGVEGESMLLQLDNLGIAISTGSACSSGSLEPSHVLMAIGCPQELAHGSLRVTVGRHTTDEDVEAFLTGLKPIVERLRSMSPVYERMFGRG